MQGPALGSSLERLWFRLGRRGRANRSFPGNLRPCGGGGRGCTDLGGSWCRANRRFPDDLGPGGGDRRGRADWRGGWCR
ncbi:MAG: hypothetical protein J6U40_02920, partial [Kiritimatiellae bacterium]|nr:hypothetical protein [Kiritimatiellia bacterium]